MDSKANILNANGRELTLSSVSPWSANVITFSTVPIWQFVSLQQSELAAGIMRGGSQWGVEVSRRQSCRSNAMGDGQVDLQRGTNYRRPMPIMFSNLNISHIIFCLIQSSWTSG